MLHYETTQELQIGLFLTKPKGVGKRNGKFTPPKQKDVVWVSFIICTVTVKILFVFINIYEWSLVPLNVFLTKLKETYRNVEKMLHNVNQCIEKTDSNT